MHEHCALYDIVASFWRLDCSLNDKHHQQVSNKDLWLK
jgi:hypothetical protein